MMSSTTTIFRLGRVEYADALEMQRQFQAARRAGVVGDTLLLLEHPPVLTLGRAARASNVIAPPQQLEREGVAIFETDRGGDVTYHGPGQIVGYPILHLPPERQDVRRYVRMLEEVVIRALSDFGLAGTRLEQWPGVWIAAARDGGPRKICALGVHISRWYTRHGFALNVAPRLEHFRLIVPCGIKEAGVTSMERELGAAPAQADVEQALQRHFGAVFECDCAPAPPPLETVSVIVRSADEAPARLLLLRRIPERGGFWQPVTGRVEAGEAVEAAARRELTEETGLRLAVTPLGYAHSLVAGPPPRGDAGLEDSAEQPVAIPQIIHETAFVAVAPGGAAPAPVRLDPSEHDAAEWLGPSEALARLPFEGLKVAARLGLR